MADELFTGKWYPWYAEKALGSEVIDSLTLLEEGAYRRALDKSWIKGSLPADPVLAARMIGKGCTPKVAARVLELFSPDDERPDRMIHKTLERVRKEQGEKHSKRVEAGKARARQRAEANKNGGAVSNATALPEHPPTDKELDIDKEEDKKEELREGTASPPEPEAEPECKPVDTRKNHPAIVAIREVTNRYPPKEIWDELIDQIGFDADTVRLRKCYAAWIGYGYNRTNFNWVYDWYVSDRIPKTGEKNGTHRSNQNGKRDTSTDRIAATADIYSKYPTEAELAGQS